jgi:tetratricopeptide (TPR) repeat protein
MYSLQAANFVENAAANLKIGEDAAQNALRLNPQSSEGLVSLGGIYSEEGREREAIQTMRRAVVAAPNNENAWQMMGYSLYYAGLNDGAEQAYRRILELNPTLLQPHWMHARTVLYQGRAQEAEQEMRQLVAKNPDSMKGQAYLGAILYYEGRFDEAAPHLDRGVALSRDSGDDSPRLLAAFLYAARKQREKIDPRLLKYVPDGIVDGDEAYWVGGVHALLGDRQLALAFLRRTAELGDVNYPWFERDRNYDSLRTDAEYQSIMAGIHQRWEEYEKEFGGVSVSAIHHADFPNSE